MKFVRFLATKALALLTGVVVLTMALAVAAIAQTCATGNDIDPGTKTALEKTGQQFFDMAGRGDVAGMRQNAIPSLASSFGAVETAVNDNKPLFTGAQANVHGMYLLDAPGTAPLARAEFFCGVWRTPQFAGFAIPNLPPGRYAVLIEDLTGGKAPATMSLVLQQAPGDGWKLAGFFTHANLVAGHDGQWYLDQARQYKAKGQVHNAWLYYNEARDLLAPVPFMSTQQLDQLYDEIQSAKPPDLPSASAPLTLTANGKAYNVSDMFAVPLADGLDVVARYQSPDISDTAKTFADNMALIKALVAKYPELRQGFAGVVVRAVAPNGNDYGTLLAMKDVK